jgi:3-phenylpropionate/cinnamic acid dioxygenase small subunit
MTAPTADVDRVRSLAHRAEIVDVAVRYATALDRRDWSLLRTCFTADATVDYEGMAPVVGRDAVVEVCRGALEELDASQHLLGNHSVELTGDTARAECYLQAQHVRRGLVDGETYIVAGTYSDRLTRGEDGWRIEHRRLTVSWTDGNAAVLAP